MAAIQQAAAMAQQSTEAVLRAQQRAREIEAELNGRAPSPTPSSSQRHPPPPPPRRSSPSSPSSAAATGASFAAPPLPPPPYASAAAALSEVTAATTAASRAPRGKTFPPLKSFLHAHTLTVNEDTDAWACNACTTEYHEPRGVRRYTCSKGSDACDFDLCEMCAHASAKQADITDAGAAATADAADASILASQSPPPPRGERRAQAEWTTSSLTSEDRARFGLDKQGPLPFTAASPQQQQQQQQKQQPQHIPPAATTVRTGCLFSSLLLGRYRNNSNNCGYAPSTEHDFSAARPPAYESRGYDARNGGVRSYHYDPIEHEPRMMPVVQSERDASPRNMITKSSLSMEDRRRFSLGTSSSLNMQSRGSYRASPPPSPPLMSTQLMAQTNDALMQQIFAQLEAAGEDGCLRKLRDSERLLQEVRTQSCLG